MNNAIPVGSAMCLQFFILYSKMYDMGCVLTLPYVTNSKNEKAKNQVTVLYDVPISKPSSDIAVCAKLSERQSQVRIQMAGRKCSQSSSRRTPNNDMQVSSLCFRQSRIVDATVFKQKQEFSVLYNLRQQRIKFGNLY